MDRIQEAKQELLMLINLRHHQLSTSAAVFVVAAKPNQRKQERPNTLSSMLSCQVSRIRRLTDELITQFQHSRGVRQSASQSELHRHRLAAVVEYLRSSQWQQPFQLEMQYNGCGAEGVAQPAGLQ